MTVELVVQYHNGTDRRVEVESTTDRRDLVVKAMNTNLQKYRETTKGFEDVNGVLHPFAFIRGFA